MKNIRIIRVEEDIEFEHVFEIRRIVFGEEQNVPESVDIDGYDATAFHYLAVINDEPCGTARWRVTPYGKVKLERFAVLKNFRGMGVGKALVEAVLRDLPGGREIFLNAQQQVVPFYEQFGFVAEGEIFFEAEIPHQKMVKK